MGKPEGLHAKRLISVGEQESWEQPFWKQQGSGEDWVLSSDRLLCHGQEWDLETWDRYIWVDALEKRSPRFF